MGWVARGSLARGWRQKSRKSLHAGLRHAPGPAGCARTVRPGAPDARGFSAGGARRRSGARLAATALPALDEVDDQRHAVHAVARAQAVLQEVGVVARDPRARVDLDREARRALADLGHVDQLQAMLAGAAARAHRRLARLHGLREEAVELGGGDAPAIRSPSASASVQQPRRRGGRSWRSRSAPAGAAAASPRPSRARASRPSLIRLRADPTCSARAPWRSRPSSPARRCAGPGR